MRDVIDATAHDHFNRAVAGMQQRPEILAGKIRGERPAIMRAETLMALAMHNAGADGDEFQQMLVPFQALDGEFDADNAVRPHRGGLGAHARHREFARVVHGFGEHIHFLVFRPGAVLDADMIDAGADAQADRLETCFAHQQKFVDRKIRGENAGGMHRRAQAFETFLGVDWEV